MSDLDSGGVDPPPPAASVSASGWVLGVALSVAASVIGGASKLAIRKSWVMVRDLPRDDENADADGDRDGDGDSAGGGDAVGGGDYRLADEWEDDDNGDDCGCDDDDLSDNCECDGGATVRSRSDWSLYGFEDYFPLPPRPPSPDHLGRHHHRHRHHHHHHHRHQHCRHHHQHGDGRASHHAHRAPHNLIPPRAAAPSAVATRRRAVLLRLSGMIGMTLLNPLCCVSAMNYASPSILAPFSGLTLVWIVLFSECAVGERPTRNQVGAAGLIVLGEVTVSVWGDHTTDANVSVEDIVDSYREAKFWAYAAGVTLWMCLLGYLMVRPPTPALRRFAWGVSGGSITGLQNFLKDALTVLKRTVAISDTTGAVPRSSVWLAALLLSLAAASSFAGLLFLTACMSRYDATYSSAAFVGSFVASASVMCLVHYNTLSDLGGMWDRAMYALGLGVLLAGVAVLVRETTDDDDDDDTADAVEGGGGDEASGSYAASVGGGDDRKPNAGGVAPDEDGVARDRAEPLLSFPPSPSPRPSPDESR